MTTQEKLEKIIELQAKVEVIDNNIKILYEQKDDLMNQFELLKGKQ